jgi:hypothetical protein
MDKELNMEGLPVGLQTRVRTEVYRHNKKPGRIKIVIGEQVSLKDLIPFYKIPLHLNNPTLPYFMREVLEKRLSSGK